MFTDDCASFRFKNYESPKDISKIVSYQQRADFLSAKGVSNLDFESEISREIVWMGAKDFFLFDRVSSSKRKGWRVQFLLHPDIIFEIGDDSVKLLGDSHEVSLNFIVNEHYSISVEPGYYSESFMGAKETKIIVLSGVGSQVDVKTYIRVKHD